MQYAEVVISNMVTSDNTLKRQYAVASDVILLLAHAICRSCYITTYLKRGEMVSGHYLDKLNLRHPLQY